MARRRGRGWEGSEEEDNNIPGKRIARCRVRRWQVAGAEGGNIQGKRIARCREEDGKV